MKIEEETEATGPDQPIVVTGGTGFIGGKLVDRLLQGENYVRATSYRGETDDRGDKLRWFNVGSIDRDTDWCRVLDGAHVVVHTAGLAHVSKDKQDVELANEVNCLGTLNLASQAASAGVQRFVYLSTAAVLGDETISQPLRADKERRPSTPYARSKADAERLLEDLGNQSSMEIVIVRPPLVYGPTLKGNFPRLVRLVCSGLPLPLGGLRNRRSMIYVENLVDVLVLVIGRTGQGSESLLVSDGQDLSTPELITLIAESCGRKARLFSLPYTVLAALGKVSGTTAAIQKLCGSLYVDSADSCDRLGWQPTCGIEESIAASVRAVVESYSINRSDRA